MSVFKRTRDSFGTTTPQSPPRSTSVPPPPPAIEHPPAPAAPAVQRQPEAVPAASPVMQPARVISRDSAAVIDRNTELTGNLHSKGNILIEGKFQGDIEANETVVIDQDADAKGHVSANEVVVSGSFDGEIVCRRRTQITSSASIKGEIKTPILVIEEGSTVDCRFEMSREGR